jgi:hypothetical protein
MAARVLNRKLEQFKIHAHVGRKPADYNQLFRGLTRLTPQQRELVSEDRLTAIPRLNVKQGIARLVALEGPVGLNPLVYSLEDQSERIQSLRRGEVVVSRTHAVIDMTTHDAVVEFNLRGAKARDIEAILQRAGRTIKGFERLDLALVPVVSEDFVGALDDFERIQSATVRLRRPNFDWSDVADGLTEAAARSEAQAANVEFTAGRGGSLDQTDGVIGFLRRVARGRGPSAIEGASVVGRRGEDSGDTRVTLRGYTRHRRASLRRAPDGQAEEEGAFDALLEFESEIRAHQDSGDL